MPKKVVHYYPAPLTGSFMFTAIIGFLISAMFVYAKSFNWGLTFMIFFGMMFIASLIAMAKSNIYR